MAPSRALPPRLHLPSGAVVRLSDAAARRAASDLPVSRGRRGGLMDHPAVLTAPGVVSVPVGALALADAPVLCAVLAHAGVVPEAPAEFTCGNCGAAFEAAPSSLLEIGPFVDGELDDPELDAAFEFDAEHTVGRRTAVRLAPRTLDEALPLWRASRARALRISPAVAVAMGVTALGGERQSSGIAAALARAPARLWGELVDLWNEAHYPARLVAVHRCAGCGGRNDLDVPLERELAREPPSEAAGSEREARFPDLDAFEERVRRIADEVYRARRVRNIDLFIDDDVPACDDGGEPLLGCYTPGAPGGEGGVAQPPEIRLFYRTFAGESRADPRFDVDAEIRETIDHEITHHLNDMGGEDPLDDEERDAIAREEARLVGKAEGLRRARRGLGEELGGFWRITWPVWVIALAGTLLALCADRSP